MPSNIVTWQLDGTMHKVAVDRLRKELTDAIASNGSFRVGRLFELLPLVTPQQNDAAARGMITFQNGVATNISNSPLTMTLNDPAMGQFTLKIPAVATAKVSNTNTNLTIEFTGAIFEMDIPNLANQGLDRSEYQTLFKIHVTERSSVTEVVDSL